MGGYIRSVLRGYQRDLPDRPVNWLKGPTVHRAFCRTRQALTWAAPAILIWIALVGCTAPPAAEGPTLDRIAAPTEDAYALLWNSTCDTLRNHFMALDRQDRANGVITTHPETTSQAWELWRPQPVDPYYWAEANFQTIQRQVRVDLRPVPETAGEYELQVRVERFRYCLEERQIDNAAAALRLFSSAAPTSSGRMRKLKDSSYWLPLGRDAGLEERLLAEIRQRCGQRAGELEPAPTTQPVQP